MPEQPQTSDLISYRIAVRTATVAAIFSLIVAALLLYDFFHRSMKDPSQTAGPRSTLLKAALKQQPANESIKEEIRKLDQQSRDEYFRQQAFALSGAGLLCGGIIVSLAAAKWAATLRRKHPQPQPVAAQQRLGGDLDSGRAVDRGWAVRRARRDGGRLDLAAARHGGGEAGRQVVAAAVTHLPPAKAAGREDGSHVRRRRQSGPIGSTSLTPALSRRERWRP